MEGRGGEGKEGGRGDEGREGREGGGETGQDWSIRDYGWLSVITTNTFLFEGGASPPISSLFSSFPSAPTMFSPSSPSVQCGAC